jgi:tetratricopeptide (TPR) repeat protein
MRNRCFTIAIALAALVGGAASVRAQDLDAAMRECGGDAGVSPEKRAAACTTMIDSGRYTGMVLALAYQNRGIAHADARDFDRAIADHTRAIQLQPDLADAFLNRGVCHAEKRDYARAIADFGEVLRLKPGNAAALNARCFTRAIADQLDEALPDCDRALAQSPNDPDFRDSRGLTHLKMGTLDAAIADYDAALKRDPKLATALYGRGIAHRRKGDEARAAADIEAATKLKPAIAEEMARYGVKYGGAARLPDSQGVFRNLGLAFASVEARCVPLCAIHAKSEEARGAVTARPQGSIDREARAAAAGRLRVGVADGEVAAHEILFEVELGIGEELERGLVDDDLDAVLLEDAVVGIDRAVEVELVLEARAAAARDGDAHHQPRLALGSAQRRDAPGGVGGDREAVCDGVVHGRADCGLLSDNTI